MKIKIILSVLFLVLSAKLLEGGCNPNPPRPTPINNAAYCEQHPDSELCAGWRSTVP